MRHGASTVLMVSPASGAEHGHAIGEEYFCPSSWSAAGQIDPGMPSGFASTEYHSMPRPSGPYCPPPID